MESFKEFGFSEQILANLKQMNYEKPTDVQAQAIPALLEKKDVVIQSQTGSGKTSAFGLPIVHGVMTDVPAVQFVVLVPTRELAAQVRDEFVNLCRDTDIKHCAIYGGADMDKQIRALRDGAQIVIGTPGRILDHLRRRTMSFSVVRGVVLDEGDKMLSMGFFPDVQSIFNQLPKLRQTVLSSATFPYVVEQLIYNYMTDPVTISLSTRQMAPDEINHQYCAVQSQEKEGVLLALMEKEQPDRSMIFCNTKTDVKSLQFFLSKAGIEVVGMSSDLTQAQREKTLHRLRSGEIQHMVCTDLAARGIDIPELSHVFIFSSSGDSETYVHRTGRTGRAGKPGTAISLVSTHDLAGFQTALRVNDIEAVEISIPTEEEINQARMEKHFTELEEIGFARDADIRQEYALLAEKLTPEQVKSLLPLLLERFWKPLVMVQPQRRPDPVDSSRPERESRRGRGRRGDRGERGERGERNSERGERSSERSERSSERSERSDKAERSDRNERNERNGGERNERTGSERNSGERSGRGERGRSNRAERGRRRRSPQDRRQDSGERPSRSASGGSRRNKVYETICIGLGRQDGLDEMDLQNILRRQGRARMDDIGDIAMKDHESFVDIGSDSLGSVLAADGKHFKSFEIFISKSPVSLDEARSLKG